MSLLAAYEQFLKAPNSASLSDDASLYYITTTTAVHGSAEIIKHLIKTRNQLKKNKETVLSTVESATGLAIETETALEFLTSGGPYLPALDDNFLADRKVEMPITHFVTFDAAGKITQIRQCWDQGALLKQIDIIGKSGRNWPIRDAPEQIKMIARSVAVGGSGIGAGPGSQMSTLPVRSRDETSLKLFASREEQSATAPVVPPYAGRRQDQRSFEDILGDEDDEEEGDEPDVVGDSPSARGRTRRLRSRSPTKHVAPKAGSKNKFEPVRLYEADAAAAAALEDVDENRSPERYYRPNPKRYDHFELADGSDQPKAPKASGAPPKPKPQHTSQWSFEQFSEQPEPRKARSQDVRHFGIENDEFPETPSAASRKQAPARPRPDAEPHFEFQDDGLPSGESRATGRPRGTGQNEGQGLYKNNLYKEDGSAPTPAPARAMGNITNLKDRTKMFQPHFAMSDKSESPVTAASIAAAATASDDRKKAVQKLEANWATDLDDSEDAPIPGTNVSGKGATERGITIGGDGMGGKKAGRSWSFGGDDDPDAPAPVPGKKPNKANQASDFWDF